MDLAEFLLARLAEDEQVAKAAIRQHEAAVEAFKAGRPADMEDLPEETSACWSGGSDESQDGHWRQAVWAGDGIATVCEMLDEYDSASPAHIARHDPARVLAEVEAKRGLVELHATKLTARGTYEGRDYRSCLTCDPTPPMDAPNPGPCATLKLLALPFADHPECHPSWLPAVKARP